MCLQRLCPTTASITDAVRRRFPDTRQRSLAEVQPEVYTPPRAFQPTRNPVRCGTGGRRLSPHWVRSILQPRTRGASYEHRRERLPRGIRHRESGAGAGRADDGREGIAGRCRSGPRDGVEQAELREGRIPRQLRPVADPPASAPAGGRCRTRRGVPRESNHLLPHPRRAPDRAGRRDSRRVPARSQRSGRVGHEDPAQLRRAGPLAVLLRACARAHRVGSSEHGGDDLGPPVDRGAGAGAAVRNGGAEGQVPAEVRGGRDHRVSADGAGFRQRSRADGDDRDPRQRRRRRRLPDRRAEAVDHERPDRRAQRRDGEGAAARGRARRDHRVHRRYGCRGHHRREPQLLHGAAGHRERRDPVPAGAGAGAGGKTGSAGRARG